MAANTVTKAKEVVTGTIMESDLDATDSKLHPQPKSVFKPPCDMRSEIERALNNFGVVKKTNAELIVENLLTKWTNTL